MSFGGGWAPLPTVEPEEYGPPVPSSAPPPNRALPPYAYEDRTAYWKAIKSLQDEFNQRQQAAEQQRRAQIAQALQSPQFRTNLHSMINQAVTLGESTIGTTDPRYAERVKPILQQAEVREAAASVRPEDYGFRDIEDARQALLNESQLTERGAQAQKFWTRRNQALSAAAPSPDLLRGSLAAVREGTEAVHRVIGELPIARRDAQIGIALPLATGVTKVKDADPYTQFVVQSSPYVAVSLVPGGQAVLTAQGLALAADAADQYKQGKITGKQALLQIGLAAGPVAVIAALRGAGRLRAFAITAQGERDLAEVIRISAREQGILLPDETANRIAAAVKSSKPELAEQILKDFQGRRLGEPVLPRTVEGPPVEASTVSRGTPKRLPAPVSPGERVPAPTMPRQNQWTRSVDIASDSEIRRTLELSDDESWPGVPEDLELRDDRLVIWSDLERYERDYITLSGQGVGPGDTIWIDEDAPYAIQIFGVDEARDLVTARIITPTHYGTHYNHPPMPPDMGGHLLPFSARHLALLVQRQTGTVSVQRGGSPYDYDPYENTEDDYYDRDADEADRDIPPDDIDYYEDELTPRRQTARDLPQAEILAQPQSAGGMYTRYTPVSAQVYGEGSGVAQFRVGGHIVDVYMQAATPATRSEGGYRSRPASPATLTISFHRDVADWDYGRKIPGGSIADLKAVGLFLDDLRQHNPDHIIQANAADERLRQRYVRMAMDTHPEAIRQGVPNSSFLILNPEKLSRSISRMSKLDKLPGFIKRMLDVDQWLDYVSGEKTIPDEVLDAIAETSDQLAKAVDAQAIEKRLDILTGQTAHPQAGQLPQPLDLYSPQAAKLLASEAAGIDEDHFVLNDALEPIYPPEFMREVARAPFMRGAVEMLEGIMQEAADSGILLELQKYLAARGIDADIQPTSFGGFDLSNDAMAVNWDYYLAPRTRHLTSQSRFNRIFGHRRIYPSLFQFAESIATKAIYEPWDMPGAAPSGESFTRQWLRIFLHEFAHSANPKGMPHGESNPHFFESFKRAMEFMDDDQLAVRKFLDKMEPVVAQQIATMLSHADYWRLGSYHADWYNTYDAARRRREREQRGFFGGIFGSPQSPTVRVQPVSRGAEAGYPRDAGGAGVDPRTRRRPAGGLPAGVASTGGTRPPKTGLAPTFASARGSGPGPQGAGTDPAVTELLDAVTAEDAGKRSTIQNITAAVAALRTHFGAAARAERATDRTAIAGARNIAVRYEGAIGMADELAGLETRELQRQFHVENLPEEEKRGITMSLDDLDPALRQQFDNLLSGPARAVRDELRTRIDRIGDMLEARGILRPEDRKANGYIPHIFDFTDEGRQLAGSRPLHTPRPKTKAGIITGWRTHRSLIEGIKAGLKPATLDPFKIYEQYVAEATKRMAMADVIQDLRTYDPQAVFFLKAGEKLPEGYSLVHHPVFEGQIAITDAAGEPRILTYRWAVRNNVAQYIKALAEPSHVRQGRVGSAALKLVASIKRTTLGAPLDINFAGFEAKAVMDLVGTDSRSVLAAGFMAAAHSQEAHDRWLNEVVRYGGQNVKRIEVYERLARAGLTAGSYRTEISRMLGADTPSTLIGLIPYLGKAYDKAQGWMESWQFDRAIPVWKREAALQLIKRKMRKKGMTLEAAEREAAADVNRAMGGLNLVAAGRSKTAQDIMSLLFIAPDWMESRLRLYGSAVMPGAQNATSRRFLIRAMIMGATATVIGSALYGQERGWSRERTLKYIADNLNPIVIRNGEPHINANFMSWQSVENGQWMSALTWEKDGWKLLFGLAATAQGDFEAANLTLGNYLSSRLGTGPRLIKEALANRDFRALPIRREKGWAGVLQFAEYEASQLTLPAAGRELAQAFIPNFPGGKQSQVGAVVNISGLGRARPINPFDTLDRALQDEHIQKADGSGEYEHYRDLPNDIKGEFDKRHPNEVAAVRKYRADQGQDTFDRISQGRIEGLAKLAPLADWKTGDPRAYREQTGQLSRDQALLAQYELQKLKEEGVDLGKREGDLGILDGYFEATKAATDPQTHVTDFDKHDALSESYRETLNPTQQKRLDEMLGYSADETYRGLKADKKKLDDAGYFERRDQAFSVFVQEAKKFNQTAPADQKIPSHALKSEDDLIAWIKQDIARQGYGAEYYTNHPVYTGWQSIYDNVNGEYLAGLGKLEDLAIRWGYQQAVHSQEAYDAYKARTGLEPKLP